MVVNLTAVHVIHASSPELNFQSCSLVLSTDKIYKKQRARCFGRPETMLLTELGGGLKISSVAAFLKESVMHSFSFCFEVQLDFTCRMLTGHL